MIFQNFSKIRNHNEKTSDHPRGFNSARMHTGRSGGWIFDAKKETVEAAENLKNEVLEVKHTVEVKTQQVKTAADSVSKAADSISQASTDLKAVTSEVE